MPIQTTEEALKETQGGFEATDLNPMLSGILALMHRDMCVKAGGEVALTFSKREIDEVAVSFNLVIVQKRAPAADGSTQYEMRLTRKAKG